MGSLSAQAMANFQTKSPQIINFNVTGEAAFLMLNYTFSSNLGLLLRIYLLVNCFSKIDFDFGYLYVSACEAGWSAVWVSEYMCLQSAEEYSRYPEAGGRGCCETCSLGDGNQTRIICKHILCS